MPLTLLGQHSPLASASEQLKVLEQPNPHLSFQAQLDRVGLSPLCSTGITVFQINVGKLCNQTCRHCHVDAGPDRSETMSLETAEHCMKALARTDIPTVDITGGAPELNPHFRWLVEQSHRLGRHIMDRLQSVRLTTPFTSRLGGISRPASGRDHRLSTFIPGQPDRCPTRRRHLCKVADGTPTLEPIGIWTTG